MHILKVVESRQWLRKVVESRQWLRPSRLVGAPIPLGVFL
jgi:hypothetical protein